jgi:hypothetical protein
MKAKYKQLRSLLEREATPGRVKEVQRLVRELWPGPRVMTEIAMWLRRGPKPKLYVRKGLKI